MSKIKWLHFRFKCMYFFVTMYGFTVDEAANMSAEMRDYWHEKYSAKDAVMEEMSYWSE